MACLVSLSFISSWPWFYSNSLSIQDSNLSYAGRATAINLSSSFPLFEEEEEEEEEEKWL
jgi:hypothetical protein